MDFINTPQRWENQGVKPTDELAKEGFKAGYKPPAAYFNYLFHNYYECLNELQEAVSNGTSDADLEDLKKKITTLEETKANKPKPLNVTIPHTAWTGSKAPYTATITVDALTGAETEYVEVFVPYEATTEQKTAWAEAGVASGDNKAKQLILEALGDKPGIDIPITLIIREE